MPMCEIKDHKTGETLKAYDFGGPEIYYAGTSLVYAPLGGTSVSTVENIATLNPLGLTSIMKQRWEVTGHVGIGTANWRVSVIDTSTGETKEGVYPFNLQGNVYELECQPGTWVIASCGGYKIESSWSGQQSNEAYRLKGTGEIMTKFRFSIVHHDITHDDYIYFWPPVTVLSDLDYVNFNAMATVYQTVSELGACLLTYPGVPHYYDGEFNTPYLPIHGKISYGYNWITHISQTTLDTIKSQIKNYYAPRQIAYENDKFSKRTYYGNLDVVYYKQNSEGFIVEQICSFKNTLQYLSPWQVVGIITKLVSIFGAKYIASLPSGDYGE